MLQGMMMKRPLLVSSVLEFGAEVQQHASIVSSTVEGGIHKYGYADAAKRAAQMAHALKELGVQQSDRVATLAWNGYRHFELYYAISGMGAICHTINPRLFEDQMLYIIGHAQDRVLFFDITFAPLVAKMHARLPDGIKLVAMTDRAHMPDVEIPGLLCYEELIAGQPETIDWPEFSEDTACTLCYTSGTTGDPKGALYSHRSMILHSLFGCATMQDSLRRDRTILPVVPLFHVNAWGLPYCAPLAGASLVFPGPRLDGASLFELMDEAKVYSSWGVPTVWQGLLGEIKKRGRKPEGLSEVVIGGSAAPRPMIEVFEKELDVRVCHAWGMTEMSPVGSHGVLPAWMNDSPQEQQLDMKQRQGRRCFGVEFKIVDDDGTRQPHDGKAVGELYVRGNTVVSGYFKNEEATQKALDGDGWFGTGDVASIDDHGVLTIQDRAKDLVKSGGEWISSIDLENAAMAHPGIANCAVIGVHHTKWDERPILIAVASGAEKPTLEDIHATMLEHFAKWQLPDDVIWVEDLPMTATGKVSKLTLRQTLGDYKHPEER